MAEIRFTSLGNIRDPNLLALIEELEQATDVESAAYLSLPLMVFLTQCVYPGIEPGKRVRISSARIPFAPLLDLKVGKLPDGDLRGLCQELAEGHGRALEFFHGSKLAAFLNKAIPRIPARIKVTSSKQARQERIVRQRRANRDDASH